MTMRQIPYGCTVFRDIVNEDRYYVDKTMYIPKLEEMGNFLLYLRPRRFGKSLFIDMLRDYYDINNADAFEQEFSRLFIGERPTRLHSSFLVMSFNFSEVEKSDGPAGMQKAFVDYCNFRLSSFVEQYRRFFSAEELESVSGIASPYQKLYYISESMARHGQQIYLLIDEYDNFANSILAEELAGEANYRLLTHGTGFFRDFFIFIKGAATGGEAAIKRIFITGVSPITLDDVTSGFNIALNISTDSIFNSMLGFTEADVRTMLEYYRNELQNESSVEHYLAEMKRWYDNYCFSPLCAGRETIFNTDMVLYYMKSYSLHNGLPPEEMLDPNVKTDYNKLKSLIFLDKRLNGNFSALCTLNDENLISGELVTMFGIEQTERRDAFISLLYYLGIVTIVDKNNPLTYFAVPNQTVRLQTFAYIASALAELPELQLDTRGLSAVLQKMAAEGAWQPALDMLAEITRRTLSLRDLVIKEKGPQLLHRVYMGLSSLFLTYSERELNLGYSDLLLLPGTHYEKFVRHAYLLEFKYLNVPKGSRSCLAESVETAIQEAASQLRRYRQDASLLQQCGTAQLHSIAVVYCGARLLKYEEITE